MMKTAKIIHNPTAGEGGKPSREDLISMVESAGFKCSYLSTKEEGWKEEEFGHADFLIAAGGDGTVRKVVSLLLEKNLLEQGLPVGLLPVGTANNIASALGIKGERDQIIKSWKIESTRRYDLSVIGGLDEGRFFIEGFGYGLFPHMVKKLKAKKAANVQFEGDKLTVALKELQELIPTFQASYCRLVVDGKEYHGNFLLVEVLNIPGIGPNLKLAPGADPGDGSFDVVMVTDEQRTALADYVAGKLQGKHEPAFFTTLRAKRVEVYAEDNLLHVDDEMVELDTPRNLTAEVTSVPLVFFK